jgi:hypothetical protein
MVRFSDARDWHKIQSEYRPFGIRWFTVVDLVESHPKAEIRQAVLPKNRERSSTIKLEKLVLRPKGKQLVDKKPILKPIGNYWHF